MDSQLPTRQSTIIAEPVYQDEEDPRVQQISQMLCKMLLAAIEKRESNPILARELALKVVRKLLKLLSQSEASTFLAVRENSKKKPGLQQPSLVRHTEKTCKRKKTLEKCVDKAFNTHSKKQVKKGENEGNKSKNRSTKPMSQTPKIKREKTIIQHKNKSPFPKLLAGSKPNHISRPKVQSKQRLFTSSRSSQPSEHRTATQSVPPSGVRQRTR